MSDKRGHLSDSERVLALMEDHIRNNEMKLIRLHMGVDKVLESSERAEKKLNEMVDDVATLRTRVAHLREDIDELASREMTDGRVFTIAGAVVGAAIAVATAVLALIR